MRARGSAGTAPSPTPCSGAGVSTIETGASAFGRVANQASDMLVMKKSVASTAVSFEKKVAEPRAPNTVPEAPEPKPAPASAPRPFGLPFAEPSGPGTWYLGQGYGNTVGAYFQRDTTYRAGQGLHFGLDLAASCGTPVVAIGDGIVREVDSGYHGAAPHNVMVVSDHGSCRAKG